MNNKYSVTLLIIMVGLILVGSLLALLGNLWGIIPLTLGIVMTKGFKELQKTPRTIGLISFFSRKTTTKVEGLILLLDIFGIEVVGVVEFNMVKKDLNFDIPQVTSKGVDNSKGDTLGGGTLSGKVEIGITPDENDNGEISGGEKLKKYDDSGREDGIKALMESIVLSATQEVCKERSPDYNATQGYELGKELKRILEGYNIDGTRDIDSHDDIRSFGAKIVTCVLKLQKDAKVVAADQKKLVSEVMNTRIMNRRGFYQEEITRLKALRASDPTIEVPKLPNDQAIRLELLEEDRNAEGKITEVRGGGVNVNKTDVI